MKATIVGNLGADAEMKTAGETPLLEFSLADSVGYGDKQTTQWVKCTIWGKRAESKLALYLKKGQQVVVFGEVKLATWENRDGVEKSRLECRVDDLKLVGSRKDSGAARAEAPASSSATGTSFDDDDIPF